MALRDANSVRALSGKMNRGEPDLRLNGRAKMPTKAGGPPSCLSDPLALQQFHIKGRFANLCTGGLFPGRIRIGNLCLSACRSSCSPNPT
jgi:hypothetical protein